MRRRLCLNGKLLALWLCFGAVGGALAVEKAVLQDMVLRNWEIDDGLPSARINAVVRTSDGYLWLATQKGVVRFDGTRFVVFDTSNTPGMKDDRASCLLLDSHGDLWAGTYGATLLKREGQGFRAQDLGTAAKFQKELGIARGKVNALAEDGQGALWVAIEDMGLMRFHNGQVEKFDTTSGLASDNVRIVLCDDARRLWAVAEGELRIFEGGRWRAPGGWSPISQNVRSISQARDGGLWIATTVGIFDSHDSRVYKLKEGQSSAQLQPYPWPADSQQFQRLALLEDQSGRIWCTTAGGVFLHTPGAPCPWQRLLSVAPWVQVEVLCLTEDENGLFWMGTRTTGLLQVQKRQVTTLPLPESQNHPAVLTVCASRDGSVWCGTDGAGIFRWQGEQMTPFGTEQGLTSLHVATLLEDRHTNLWAGTYAGLFRRVGGGFEPVPGLPALRESITALLEDRAGNLWTGGRAGLVRLSAEGAKLFGANEGLGGAVRALAEDREGRIWVGPNAGLYWLDGETFRHYSVPQVPHLQGILALHCDTSGSLWIGTDLAGLLRFHADYFDQWLGPRDGLPSNHLTAILEDDEGDLWMSSENGIFACSKPDLDKYVRGVTPPLQPRRLTPAEGLVHKVCSGVGQPSACKSADGRLWFPDGPALAVFAPATIPRTVRVWPPLIEGASADGVPTTLVPGGLRVRSGVRRIDFQYTSPNMLTPERLRFRFRLDGVDKDWVQAGTRRDASYSRLPPGNYEFKVQASGPEGAWQEGRALQLEILPQLWERPSFQLAAGLALLAGVAGTVWALERGRSRRRLERLELQRTLDAERQRIARDIHDDLGSGLTEIILLSDSLDEAIQPTPADQKMVGEISARARSLTRAMDEVVWAINPRNDTLEGFLTYLGKFTQDYLTKAEVRCRWNVPTDVPELPLSAEMRHNLYLACKEALHNIVKHAGASEVSIRLDQANGGFILSIEDDGQGFAAALPPTRGNGLSNMRQRLKALRGVCSIESAPGRGTRVLFSLPVAANKTLRP